MEDTAQTAEHGRSVTIRYEITLEDGTRIQGKDSKPLSFKIGGKKVFSALESGIVGMKIHEKRNILISPEQGYGKYKKDLLLKVERKMFPEDLKLLPGRAVQYQDRDGERANFVVREIGDDTIIIDGNHPLAGQDLIYEVELLEVR